MVVIRMKEFIDYILNETQVRKNNRKRQRSCVTVDVNRILKRIKNKMELNRLVC